MSPRKRFLIIAPSWIGDLLISQSVFKFLKNNYNECVIDIIAKPYLNGLIQLMPEINNIYDLDIRHKELGLSKRTLISKDLKKHNYSSAIILTNTFKSAIIPWLARIPERIGYKKELRSFLLTKSLNLFIAKNLFKKIYLYLVFSLVLVFT